jgi:hypothetical protein
MAKFEFPKNPGTHRENPFEDAKGDNPFTDGTTQPPEAIKDSVFEAPTDSAGRSYTPSDFEAILVPNPKGALGLAIAGLVLSACGVIGAGLAIMGSGVWTTPLFYVLPLQFGAMAVAFPAGIIARRDLRAIKAGAMSDAGRGKSRLAFWIATGAGLLGSVPVVIYFGLLLSYFLTV